MEFALQRKTGYISPYHLAMVYPSYRKGLLIQGAKGEHVAPILVRIRKRWYRVPPELIRSPSWVARKVRRLDPNGQVRN